MNDNSDPEAIRDADSTATFPASVLLRQPMPAEVAIAVAEVMKRIAKLDKTETNKHGGYRYASVDDFYEMVRPLLAETGLVIIPEELSTSSLNTTTANGTRTWLVIKYDFTLNVGGVEWEFRPKRTAMADSSMGSQAFGAAASYAEKFFLRSLFKIATGEPDIDAAEAQPLPALSSRQAQGMGQDRGRPSAAPSQQRRAEPGIKSSAQAKRDGDWEKLTKGMALQRSEEELRAWAATHEKDLAKLPRQWKIEVREQYVKELERVRDLDEKRARELDSTDLNQSLDDQGAEDDGMGFGGDALEDESFPGDRPTS